ncbi:MAG: TIGR02266 family protein [Myxococcaceae bacterium]|nr:TIGR02266 family protein [Myxococcaceae bacterium]
MGLSVKLPFGSPEEFLQKYGVNLTRGGIYLRAKSLKAPGTKIVLDLRLSNGDRLLHAQAEVAWVTGASGTGVTGMGIKFLQPDEASQRFLDSVAATLPHAKSDEPPLPANVGPAEKNPAAVAPVVPASQVEKPLPSQEKGRVVVQSAAPTIAAPAFEAPTEPPKRDGPIIGIDLGTTNSCAAFVKGGKPQVLKSREGYHTVPSILALNARGKLVVGHPAKGQLLTNPRLTVYGAKRLVGRAFESPVVQEIKDRFAYEICPGPEGDAAVRLGDRVYTLQQISALILREVRELAQLQLATPVSRAVITVPAYYNDNQRQAVREAGRLAGLHVERIVNEPTAAALAFGYGRKLSKRILIYDLGGGTFDASVLELNDTIYEVVSTGGDTFLGGLDFDNAIVAYLFEQFTAKTGLKFQGDRVAMQRVLDAAERAKCALSERTEARVHVPFLTMVDGKPLDLDVTLTRTALYDLTRELVARTIKVCGEVLAARNLKASDIDEVILVGGQSRFPLVHEQIEAFFGKKPAHNVHPDEAVALGAALLANSLSNADGIVLIDVLPMTIGVGLPGGRFKPVIPRNTTLPTKRSHVHHTTRDDQPELELTVFQGEGNGALDNEYLGTVKLTGLPKGPKGSVHVELSFEVTSECLLNLTAREETTGREVKVTLTTKDTPATVRQKLGDAAAAPGAPPAPASTKVSAAKLAPVPGPAAAAPPAEAKPKKGFLGWLKGLFGG